MTGVGTSDATELVIPSYQLQWSIYVQPTSPNSKATHESCIGGCDRIIRHVGSSNHLCDVSSRITEFFFDVGCSMLQGLATWSYRDGASDMSGVQESGVEEGRMSDSERMAEGERDVTES